MVAIACICPPTGAGETRHPGGDEITLRERLDFRGAVACRNAVLVLKSDDEDAGIGDILAVLTEAYVLEGVTGWTLVDEKGKPIEVTRARIRALLLTHVEEAMTVGDAADALYSEQVMTPLLALASTSTPPTPTNGSTSATNGSGSRHPKRSKRSSTTTTPTAATATTSSSPAGDSSSSPS